MKNHIYLLLMDTNNKWQRRTKSYQILWASVAKKTQADRYQQIFELGHKVKNKIMEVLYIFISG